MFRSFSAAFSILLISLIFLNACAPQNKEAFLAGNTMGTTFSVKYVPVEGISNDELLAQINQRLVEVNDLMSTWQDDSELSKFNDARTLEPVTVSDELLFVTKEADKLARISEGGYDVTAGKLFSLWGFDKQARPEKVPNEDEIKLARSLSGMDKLVIGESSLTKKVPELYVNLSSIAKGYGVDVVGELLESKGITNYLVEIGGEMRLRGLKGNGGKWIIAIEKPLSFERAVQREFKVTDQSIATSGDYRIYFEENGVRYSHLIDPRTAQPIRHNLVSVTVLHPSCMTADGLATLFNIIGAEDALRIAEEQKIAVMLITKESDGFKEIHSSAMKQFL